MRRERKCKAIALSAEPPALDREFPVPEDWSTLVDSVPEPPPMSTFEQQQQQQQQEKLK